MNKYQVTYTIQGFLRVFVDVVECVNQEECEVEIQKLVNPVFGNKKINVVLIVNL